MTEYLGLLDEPTTAEDAAVNRTAPLGLLVRLVDSVRHAVIPSIGVFVVAGEVREAIGFLPILGLIIVAIGFFTWLGWWKTTYRVGYEDIRVESGIVSRQARSVPYERIQDVSLEQPLIARLFGLVRVKFETGAGGGEDLNLAYVTEDEAERLRETVRTRKEVETEVSVAVDALDTPEAPPIFAMDEKRLFTFGLFEFSLVIFAVLLGAAQQFEFLLPFDVFDDDVLEPIIRGQGERIAAFGLVGTVLGAVAGVVGVIALGLVTGVVQTFVRDYGFRLDRTAKGFRRRRGLFTKTDVVMPAHRVQAMKLGTKWFRRLFGWHSLKFVSLANDAKSSSHVVVPFGQMEEIEPAALAAGIALPPEDIAWRRPSFRAWMDTAIIVSLVLIVIAAVIAVVIAANVEVWMLAVPLPIVALVMALGWLSWKRYRHATALAQVFVRTGILSPQVTTAPKTKLQSVEIAQGPLAQWRGYATVQFGLAGGSLQIPGVPLDEARRLRAEIIEAIAAVDFSEAQEA